MSHPAELQRLRTSDYDGVGFRSPFCFRLADSGNSIGFASSSVTEPFKMPGMHNFREDFDSYCDKNIMARSPGLVVVQVLSQMIRFMLVCVLFFCGCPPGWKWKDPFSDNCKPKRSANPEDAGRLLYIYIYVSAKNPRWFWCTTCL